MREYSHHEEDGKVIVDVLERKSDPIGTSLRYDDISVKHNGTHFRSSTIESVYSLKAYTKRPKDITDMQRLVPYINKEKLEQINKHPNQNVTFKNVEHKEASSGKHM